MSVKLYYYVTNHLRNMFDVKVTYEAPDWRAFTWPRNGRVVATCVLHQDAVKVAAAMNAQDARERESAR